MKKYLSLLLATIFLGCTSIPEDQNGNPFKKIAVSDVSKILLYYEDHIVGLDYVEPYLHPTHAEIRDRETINNIYDILKNTEFSTSNNYMLVGDLGYQVFFGKNNEILATTSIVKWQNAVNLHNCELKHVWIGFVSHGNKPATGYNSDYCRIIYNFMKKELPEEIEKQDHDFRKYNGGTLESFYLKNTN